MAHNRYQLILSGEPFPELLEIAEVIPLRYAFRRKGFWFQSLEQAEFYKQLMSGAFPHINCEIVPPLVQPEPVEVNKAVVDVVEEPEDEPEPDNEGE